MNADDAQQLSRLASRRLRSAKVYGVLTLQDGLGIPVLEILEAIDTGDIPRSLGLGLDTCVMGIDVVDWLKARSHNGLLPR